MILRNSSEGWSGTSNDCHREANMITKITLTQVQDTEVEVKVGATMITTPVRELMTAVQVHNVEMETGRTNGYIPNLRGEDYGPGPGPGRGDGVGCNDNYAPSPGGDYYRPGPGREGGGRGEGGGGRNHCYVPSLGGDNEDTPSPCGCSDYASTPGGEST
jgi:hypothetical protein